MKATVLSTIPLSGSVDEVRFEAPGDGTWVEFDDKEGDRWVGVFRHGMPTGKSSLALILEDQKTVFVLACGQGYMIDPQKRTCISKTNSASIVSVLSIPKFSLVIACDFQTILLYDRERLLWRSEDIASDGIVFSGIDHEKAWGKVWRQDRWFAFEFFYLERRYFQGEFLSQ